MKLDSAISYFPEKFFFQLYVLIYFNHLYCIYKACKLPSGREIDDGLPND